MIPMMIQKFLKFLVNLKFAISLLIIIAILIGIGSIIEQDQIPQYYEKNYPLDKSFLGFLNYQSIFLLQLNHVYSSFLFLFLLFLLGLSLMVCTFKQQLPSLKLCRDCVFLENPEQYSSLSVKNMFLKEKIIRFGEKSILFFESENFFLHQQKNIIYTFKGILGKIGPIFVHFSLTCILLGAILGAIGKYNAQEFLPKGEIIHLQNILGASWLSYFPKFSIRLNDFWIEYKDFKIDQFYSDLSILNNYGEELSQKTISVNNPLKYDQISFYQIDWELLGIRVKNETNFIFQYPLSLVRKTPRIWSTWIFSENFSDARIILIDELKQFVKVYDKTGKFLESLNFGDKFFIKNQNYFLLDLISETGLQFKYDPSIPLTFLGFGSLIISTFLSYKTYSQIWIAIKINKIFIGGQTTRSQSNFEIEFKKFIKFIEQKSSNNSNFLN